MTNTTSNLGLTTFNPGIDPDESFEKFRTDLDGTDNPFNNMTRVDNFAGTVALLFASTLAATSASLLPINSFVNSATGSIVSAKSASAAISASFLKIAEFSGSGQADFTSLNQNFKHIIIFGQACVAVPWPATATPQFYNVGCDFNGDTTSGSYRDATWINSGSAAYGSTGWTTGSGISSMTTHAGSQIILANITGSSLWDFGSPFFAIIPNYSGSLISGSGLYKTAMGISTFLRANFYPTSIINGSAGIQGGLFMSTSPITRIRIFGSDNSGSRMNFSQNTTISLYGLT
jgi:hypothetical protein